MHKLIEALQRLYFFPEQQARGLTTASAQGLPSAEMLAASLAGETTVTLPLISAEGLTRTMVVCFDRAMDWEQVAVLYQAVLEELDLPAPGVSVSGFKGYQIWFSLAEAIPVAEARAFLDLLRSNYLADLPMLHLRLLPNTDSAASAEQVMLAPALNAANGKWSAFIDPSMGSMFVDGPWLEMAPNRDRQADMLAGLKSIAAADFARALLTLKTPAEPESHPESSSSSSSLDVPKAAARKSHPASAQLNVGKDYCDPTSFLLAVMNDSSARPAHRIKAAQALLPYFTRLPS